MERGSDPRSRALRALSRFLISEASLADALTEVATICVDAIEPASFAGLTMMGSDGSPATAIFTDAESPEIDEAQYRSGRGPCLDAWRRREVVRLDDVAAARSVYEEFGRTALEHGVRSTLSLPLQVRGEGLGAMNLYAREPHAFCEQDEILGGEVVDAAAVLLANAKAYWGAQELSRQLSEALESRSVIEQAKGILMAADPTIDADGAFQLLVSASQRENTKLRDLATRIVSRRGAPTEA